MKFRRKLTKLLQTFKVTCLKQYIAVNMNKVVMNLLTRQSSYKTRVKWDGYIRLMQISSCVRLRKWKLVDSLDEVIV